MSSVEALVRKLAEVQDLLVALPDDDFAAREELVRQRDELRAQAELHAAGADRERPIEDLRVELASLELQLRHLPDEADRRRIEGRVARLLAVLDDRADQTSDRS